MRQQEYNEIQDIKRDLTIFVIIIIALMGVMVVSADAAEECISWNWVQTGSHTECSTWYCWNVPEYSFVCTGYAAEPEPTLPITVEPPGIWRNITPAASQEVIQIYHRPTSIGFAYTFGHNDTERYQIQKNISDMRAIYIMENIAYENGLSMEKFEQKYNIR